MKKYVFILSAILLFACSTKQQNQIKATTLIENNLTETESNIINDFLDVELSKERYKYYNGFEIAVIEEASKKMKTIEAYTYSRNDWFSLDRGKDIENSFFLDSIQIEKLKTEIENEEVYHWKVSDFKNIKISLLKYESFKASIKKDGFTKIPPRLIMFISTPLIIDQNKAFISFNIGSGVTGFSLINDYTILMKKENNKWIIKRLYGADTF